MKMRPLGKTGLTVGEIGFGAGPIGGERTLLKPDGTRHAVGWGKTDDAESLAALERFAELGGNLIDTADIYGFDGRSETIVGRFLKGKKREDFVVCSKFGLAWKGETNSGQDFSPEYMRGALEGSLRRLGVDYIDLYQMHNPSFEWRRREDVWEALHAEKKKGKIRHIGVSTGPPEDAFELLELGAEVLQVRYNLLDQHAWALFWTAARRGVGILTRVPLERGLLTGKWDASRTKDFHETDHRSAAYDDEKMPKALARVEKVRFLTEGTGRTMLAAALLFAIHDPAISATIPGAKRPAQVEENLAAAEAPPITEEERLRARKLWREEFRAK